MAATFATAAAVNAHVAAVGPGSDALAPYSDFIKFMKRQDGGDCCALRDGLADLQERMTEDGKYQVTIPRNAFPGMPNEERVIIIDPSRVLTPDQAQKVCNDNPTPTCISPPFNVLWVNPSALNIGEEYGTTVYCYWPTPKLGGLEQKHKSPAIRDQAVTVKAVFGGAPALPLKSSAPVPGLK